MTKLDGDTSVMTYRGHSVQKTLIRCRFSPPHTTGQRFIYTGCAGGRVISKNISSLKYQCNNEFIIFLLKYFVPIPKEIFLFLI